MVSAIDPGACRRHVEANFSAERMAAGYIRCYRQVLAKHEAAWRTTTDIIFRSESKGIS